MRHAVLNAYFKELESREALLQAQLAREEKERVRAFGTELPAAARTAAAQPPPSPAGGCDARAGDGAPARA